MDQPAKLLCTVAGTGDCVLAVDDHRRGRLTQTEGESRFVVDCRVNPTALVDHVKTVALRAIPEGVMVS